MPEKEKPHQRDLAGFPHEKSGKRNIRKKRWW